MLVTSPNIIPANNWIPASSIEWKVKSLNGMNAEKLNMIRPTQQPKNTSSFIFFGEITPIADAIASDQKAVPRVKLNRFGDILDSR